MGQLGLLPSIREVHIVVASSSGSTLFICGFWVSLIEFTCGFRLPRSGLGFRVGLWVLGFGQGRYCIHLVEGDRSSSPREVIKPAAEGGGSLLGTANSDGSRHHGRSCRDSSCRNQCVFAPTKKIVHQRETCKCI